MRNLGSRTTEDNYGFTVLTDYAKYVEAADGSVHSYTFKIERDEPSDLLENIVFTLQEDETYRSTLVSYHFPDFDTIGINYLDIDFDSDTVLNTIQQRDCISWFSCEQWTYFCDDCDNAPGEGSWSCTAYSYNQVCSTVETIDAGDSGGGGTSTGSGVQDNSGNQWDDTVWNGGGGGDSDGVVSSPTSDCNARGRLTITDGNGCGFQDDPECQKIKEVMNKPIGDGGKIQQVVQALSPFTSENFEVSMTIDNQNNIQAEQGVQGTAGVSFETNPTNPYAVVAHTHDAFGLDGSGTFSVFSFDDLRYLAQTIHNDKIDGTFVTILMTNKGTRYAMTINDTSKILDLFYYTVVDFPSTTEEINRYMESKQQLEPLFEEYYNLRNENRKIRVTPSDNNITAEQFNETTLKHFLKFLDEGDAGVSLYEANEDFSNFQPVTLDIMGNVKRNQAPCMF